MGAARDSGLLIPNYRKQARFRSARVVLSVFRRAGASDGPCTYGATRFRQNVEAAI